MSVVKEKSVSMPILFMQEHNYGSHAYRFVRNVIISEMRFDLNSNAVIQSQHYVPPRLIHHKHQGNLTEKCSLALLFFSF